MGGHLNWDWSARFPILDQLDFFDHAGVASISGPAAGALREYAEQAENRAYVGGNWYARLDQVKVLAARLIGADSADEIAFVANTSTGLNMVARGLKWREGDNVVITAVEYPANRYPWEDLKRFGVRLIEVEQQPDGRVDVEDVCEAITDRTRVVAVSSVQYATGFRMDLRPIARFVHQAGGYLCVDAIQCLGVTAVNVREQGIDFLSADGHKWLLSPEGCGIFYCRADLIEALHPALVGWMSMVDHTRYGDYRFEFVRTARRFEPGSYNVPGALAMGASLELFLEAGPSAIWSRIEALTGRLCEGLNARGYRVRSPREEEAERSGIVVFDAPADGESPERIVEALRRRGIVIVVREGRLRASPHFYNRPEQIDRLVDALP